MVDLLALWTNRTESRILRYSASHCGLLNLKKRQLFHFSSPLCFLFLLLALFTIYPDGQRPKQIMKLYSVIINDINPDVSNPVALQARLSRKHAAQSSHSDQYKDIDRSPPDLVNKQRITSIQLQQRELDIDHAWRLSQVSSVAGRHTFCCYFSLWLTRCSRHSNSIILQHGHIIP